MISEFSGEFANNHIPIIISGGQAIQMTSILLVIQPFTEIYTASFIKDIFMKKTERCALFIDGSNFHATTKFLNIDVDYLKLLHFFRSRSTLIRAYYYTALPDPSEQSPLRKLIDFLDYNGYMINDASSQLNWSMVIRYRL